MLNKCTNRIIYVVELSVFNIFTRNRNKQNSLFNQQNLTSEMASYIISLLLNKFYREEYLCRYFLRFSFFCLSLVRIGFTFSLLIEKL